MYKVFPLSDIKWTAFDTDCNNNGELLRQHGIEVTQIEDNADLYVCRSIPFSGLADSLFFFVGRRNIPILLWTHEPRYSINFVNYFPGNLLRPPIHIMNLYTRDVYFNNYTWFGWSMLKKLNLLNEEHFDGRQNKIGTLTSYVPRAQNHRLMFGGTDISLVAKRQQLIECAHSMGLIDIYGRSWPNDMSISASRTNQNWHAMKLDILRKYRYNIALENTNYDFYVSEKMWDSIQSGCLPIYYGYRNTIYQDFPKNSFIDLADYNSNEGLLSDINKMSKSEYIDRLNLCIEVYNRIYDLGDYWEHHVKAYCALKEKISNILDK